MSSRIGRKKHEIIMQFLGTTGDSQPFPRGARPPMLMECDIDICDYEPIYDPSKEMKPGWTKQYPTVGQGVMSFNTTQNNPFAIVVTDNRSEDWISLDVHKNCAFFTICINGEKLVVEHVESDKAGYDKGLKVSYWFSYDRDRYVLKYGKGYIMAETTLMSYQCDSKQRPDTLFDAKHDRYVKMYEDFEPSELYSEKYLQQIEMDKDDVFKVIASTKMNFSDLEEFMVSALSGESSLLTGVVDMEKKVSFEKNPLVTNRPYLVLDSSEITLFRLDRGGFTFSESLSACSRELYQNVKHIELDYAADTSKYRLSDAMRHSIETPGCILYEKLKEKKDEFGDDQAQETYLRVTLGASYGDSPGIPYVLEIWPAKHCSPVHNHGDAEAVIKVLFGTINIEIYNKFSPGMDGHEKPKELLDFNAKAGDYTWIDRNWYQTHKLQNISDDFCATIQCYKYPSTNNVHWPYFDYISEESKIEEFTPSSDFTFIEMYKKVMAEIEEAGKK